MNNDEKYMLRCIELAKKGMGFVSPNPMVGAVIVHQNNIIGEGYHQQYGGPHAEANAIKQVKNKELLKNSTLYISLEPCSHQGQTPPCSDLIIKNHIPKVIIGCKDIFEKVNGQGIEKLKNKGIDVISGLLEKKCLELNRRFFTYHQKKRPFIILKWAQTLDGYMDKNRSEKEKKGVNWITSEITQSQTHQWRADEDAILVGRYTIENDDPSLTVRAYSGKNPKRFIIDPDLKLSKDYKIFKDGNTSHLINTIKTDRTNTIKYFQCSKNNLLPDLINVLYIEKIQSIIIEGGKKTIESFIEQDLWDEVRVLTGNTFFEQGISAPKLNKPPSHSYHLNKDRIDIFRK